MLKGKKDGNVREVDMAYILVFSAWRICQGPKK